MQPSEMDNHMRRMMSDDRLSHAVHYLKATNGMSPQDRVRAIARGDIRFSSDVKGFMDDFGINPGLLQSDQQAH